MWAYEFAKKETRGKVYKLKSFLRINHDLPKLWFEEDNVPKDFRTPFIFRCLRFLSFISLIIIFVYALIPFEDIYYLDEWDRRTDCNNFCNRDFFPDLRCQESSIKLTYYGNYYSKLFVYPVPSNTSHFDTCTKYVGSNPGYSIVDHDNNRQVRLHTCFKYCKKGIELGFSGDGRPDCSIVSTAEQSQLIWVYPEDECEFTTLESEVDLFGSGKDAISFSPLFAFYAVILVLPIQFIFEILCILLARQKLINPESLKENAKI